MKKEHPPAHGLAALFTVREAADYLRLSKSRLDVLRCVGGGPRFVKVGERVVYRAADLDAFVNSRLFSSTAEFQAQKHANAA